MIKTIEKRLELRVNQLPLPKLRTPASAAILSLNPAGNSNLPSSRPAANRQSFAIIRVPIPRIAPRRWPEDPNSQPEQRQRVVIFFDSASVSVAFEKSILRLK